MRQQGWTQRADRRGARASASARSRSGWRGRARRRLADRSSRPHRQPRRLARRPKRRSSRCVGPARRPGKSAPRCGMPRSTVTRVLARVGLNRVALLEPRGAGAALRVAARRRSAAPRSQTARPRRRHWPSHPRRSPTPQRGSVGWEYLHVAIDDATRLTYAEVLAGRRCAGLRRVSAAHAALVSSARRPHPPPAHRQRDGVSRAASSAPSVAPGRCATASRGPIARRPTARPSDSFRRCSASGPTACRTAARRGARPRSARISASTTTGVHTRASVGARRGCVSKRLPKMNNLFDIHS